MTFIWDQLPPSSAPLRYKSSCIAEPQPALRFNVDSVTAQSAGLPNATDPRETIAQAICCDLAYHGLAEPDGLYAEPPIALFSKVDAAGITTFFDSVCGVPLFRAPQNRTFAAWVADTTEHGWPSFRPAEWVNEARAG